MDIYNYMYLPLDTSCLVNIENNHDNVHKSCYKITTLTLLLPSHCFDIAIAFSYVINHRSLVSAFFNNLYSVIIIPIPSQIDSLIIIRHKNLAELYN